MTGDSEQINNTLKSFAKNFDKLTFISSIGQVYQHSDLPKFYSYAATMPNTNKITDGHLKHEKKASGTSFFSEELALLKCLGEAVERESCTVYKNTDLVVSNYSKLGNKAVNPSSFKYFTEHQKTLPVYDEFIFDENTLFRWIKAHELITNKQFYIPAQTVFYNYKFHKNEGKIGIPISTGAAGGSTFESALIRGILEIIERDSFMICYLNKISRGKINLSKIKDNRIKHLIGIMKRYNIELHLIDITTNLEIPTYLSIGIDKSGLSPAVQVGAKSDFDPISAIIGAISECFITQAWFREVYFEKEKKHVQHIRTIEDRGVYWFERKNIKSLDFWTKQGKKKLVLKENNYSDKKKLEILKNIFENKGYPVYWVDVSMPVLKTIPYYVIKVIIPNLQPLYLDEECKYLGCDRLYAVPRKIGFRKKTEEELNLVPHPFP